MKRRPAALLVLALALLLSACRGGSDDSGGDPRLDDEDIARTANFRLTDFPPGWEREAAAVRRLDRPEDLRFSECMGRPPASELRTAIADSDNFSTGERTRANSSVQVVRTEDIAREDHAVLREDRALTCLRERLDVELANQNPPGGPAFQQVALERIDFPNVADDTVAFRMTVAAPSVAPGAVLLVDQVFVRSGRVEISASFVELSQPFPSQLAEDLMRKLVARAPRN